MLRNNLKQCCNRKSNYNFLSRLNVGSCRILSTLHVESCRILSTLHVGSCRILSTLHVGSRHHLLATFCRTLLFPTILLQPFTINWRQYTNILSPYAVIWRQSTNDANAFLLSIKSTVLCSFLSKNLVILTKYVSNKITSWSRSLKNLQVYQVGCAVFNNVMILKKSLFWSKVCLFTFYGVSTYLPLNTFLVIA